MRCFDYEAYYRNINKDAEAGKERRDEGSARL